jgi:hypothetical protein
MGLLVWGWVQKHSTTSVFELKNIYNTRHSYTPRNRVVPLTGIHSILNPEKQLFIIPVYEISDGFRMLCVSIRFPNLFSMEEVLKYFFIFRGNRTYTNVYRPEKNEGACSAHIYLQYCQLSELISGDISTDILKFSSCLKIPQFLAVSLTMFPVALDGRIHQPCNLRL